MTQKTNLFLFFLQRHILVKGCGKSSTHGAGNANRRSQSPLDKSEVMSDSTDDTGSDAKKDF